MMNILAKATPIERGFTRFGNCLCLGALILVATGGCTGKTTREFQPVSTKEEAPPEPAFHSAEIDAMVERLAEAPEWANLRVGSAQSQRLMEAIQFVASHDIDQIRIAVAAYLREKEPTSDSVGSKIFILNRYIFSVPEVQDASDMRVFGDWDNIQVTNHTWNPLWPLGWDKDSGQLAIIAPPASVIYSGELYAAHALSEFDYFRKKYGIRKRTDEASPQTQTN